VKAVVRRVGGLSLVGKADTNHWIAMDGPQDLGGFDCGLPPLELVLIALGGCTSMDVLSILARSASSWMTLRSNWRPSAATEHRRSSPPSSSLSTSTAKI